MDYPETKPSELRVGDIITAQFNLAGVPTRLFTNVAVTSIDSGVVWADLLHFYTDCNTFYLIERPKKPLPTAIGSVVESDGQTWVLCDPEDSTPWRSTPLGHWASSEDLQEYDFTVV